jgi:hypothetical protein
MKQIIKETVDIYNEKRPHLSNHMLKPNQMHQQNKLLMKTMLLPKNQTRFSHNLR